MPDTMSSAIAGYVAFAVILGGYILSLIRRSK
jgi:hypothetical protein